MILSSKAKRPVVDFAIALVYDGPGAAARHDAAGLHFPLPNCPCPLAFEPR